MGGLNFDLPRLLVYKYPKPYFFLITLFPWIMKVYTYTGIHTYIYTYRDTGRRTYTDIHIQRYIYREIHWETYIYRDTYNYIYILYRDTERRTYTDIHRQTYIYREIHWETYIYRDTFTEIHREIERKVCDLVCILSYYTLYNALSMSHEGRMTLDETRFSPAAFASSRATSGGRTWHRFSWKLV